MLCSLFALLPPLPVPVRVVSSPVRCPPFFGGGVPVESRGRFLFVLLLLLSLLGLDGVGMALDCGTLSYDRLKPAKCYLPGPSSVQFFHQRVPFHTSFMKETCQSKRSCP